jgi:hypothetical protein
MKGPTTIRWVARVWSIASVGLVLLIVVGELVYPHAPLPTFRDLVGMFFFSIKSKLIKLTGAHQVRLVYPIAQEK